jgi:mono/diheme cytochrome c family protein
MRYFIVILLLLAALVVSLAGRRGGVSRQPPLEVFPDMKRQPRLRPQKPSPFFGDQFASRPPVPGTVPAGALLEDSRVTTGQRPGSTNWVETNPLPIGAELLVRGREVFGIYCAPCHSATGDGQGIVTKYGLLRAGNFHDPRLVRMPDGEVFNTVTTGKNQMPSYASQVSVSNRWAVIAYVRALQRSRLGSLEDVPPEMRGSLKP